LFLKKNKLLLMKYSAEKLAEKAEVRPIYLSLRTMQEIPFLKQTLFRDIFVIPFRRERNQMARRAH